MPEHPFIIVIGASAGGITPLTELMSQFDPDINAAIFIVLHLSNTGIGTFLKDKIQQHSASLFYCSKCRSLPERTYLSCPAGLSSYYKGNNDVDDFRTP